MDKIILAKNRLEELRRKKEDNKKMNYSSGFIGSIEISRLEEYLEGYTHNYFIKLENDISFEGVLKTEEVNDFECGLIYAVENGKTKYLQDNTCLNGNKILYFKIKEYQV